MWHLHHAVHSVGRGVGSAGLGASCEANDDCASDGVEPPIPGQVGPGGVVSALTITF